MKIINQLLTMGEAHGRTGALLIPKGIAIHYVGNPGSTAAANRNWFENGAGGAHTSAHYIIGLNGEVIRCIPETERAQHAGKSYGPQWDAMAKTNNGTYIGIECCHPDASGKFNDATYTSLVELCADICRKYGFNPAKDIKRHYDVCGKPCPLYYVNNPAAWTQLVNDITEKVLSSQTSVNDTTKNANSTPVLRCGDSGESVRLMQDLLNAAGAILVADGSFGPKTEAAVKAFQTKQGLTVDGVCGPATWKALLNYQKPKASDEAVTPKETTVNHLLVDDIAKTPEEITVNRLSGDGIITDQFYWLGVLIGVVQPTPDYLKTAFDRYHVAFTGSQETFDVAATVSNLFRGGIISDHAYWLGVLQGHIQPKPEYIKTVFDRYHEKLSMK